MMKTTADAIQSIEHIYEIPIINWQGDPCIPNHFAWEGLTCSSDGNPRIISLNLSSRGLTGPIDVSFSRFTKLQSLDLSYNKMTGEVPEFLAQLSNLKFLNLTGNQLTGSIPKSLLLKSNTTLSWRLERNPGLCPTESCKTKKFPVPLLASIAASVAVLVMIVLIFLMIRKIKNKKGASKTDGLEKSNKYLFSLRDVIRITNNFKTKIGKGGFGEVYLGTLQDGRDVAVKLLSQTSRQGDREFHSEVNLLTIVHHKNLVSFAGYCDEERNPNVLKWSERLQIAVNVALGLDYLHNGIRPPVVHRDLKTSNILLNKKMEAKVSDFGLCRSFTNENDTHISTALAGTFGYLDPEFQRTGRLNKKSDVYSFGVILLELITGLRPIKEESPENNSHLLHWVNRKLKNGDIKSIVDPRLQGQYNTSSAWKFVETAMSCVPPKAIQRPDISEVLTELRICLSLNQQQGHTREKSESSSRRASNSLDMGSQNLIGFESITGPYAR